MASPVGKFDFFQDKNFPPNLHSIYETLNPEAFVDLFTDNAAEIIWRRPIKITADIEPVHPPILFLDQPGMCSRIKQGGLANCYLTAAITAIVHAKPNWVQNNIFSKMREFPSDGKITISLFHNSQWEGVEIDDNIPCGLHGYPLFARCVDELGRCQNEWWLSLLEKAYAKVYFSYANLHGGNMSEALYDLSGIPVLDYCITGGKSVARQVECDWECLWSAYVAGDAICVGYCVTGTELSSSLKVRDGIFTNHAYSLIGLFKNEKCKFVKIRNARCDSEFSGLFSRDSKIWETGSKKSELTTVVGVAGDELPFGEFLMSYVEFVTFFNRVYICRLSMSNKLPPFKGTFQSLYPSNEEFGGCSNYWSWRYNPKFHILAPNKSRVSITLTQDDQRGAQSHLDYNQIGVTVIKLVQDCGFAMSQAVGENLVAKTTFVNRRNVSVEFVMPELAPNEICVAIPSTFYPNVSLNWVLSVHSNAPEVQVREYQFAFHSRLLLPGKWSDKSAGGGPKHLSFINNPSFQVKIGEEATKIEIYLRQKIATQSQKKIGCQGKTGNMQKTASKPSTKPSPQKSVTIPKAKVTHATKHLDEVVGIGFYILKDFQHLSGSISNECVYNNTVFTNREEVHKQIKLESKQNYLLIPCTFQPRIEKDFILEILSDKEISIEKIVKSEEKTGSGRQKVSSGASQGMLEKSHETLKSLSLEYNDF